RPAFIATYGINTTMLVGAAISLFGMMVSVLFAPETKGLTLKQTSTMPMRRGKKSL
ncbi:MFS transporter, partial [Proteus mirabilis]|nr:MFS transporter [Proteus mirabilis]